MVNSLFLSLKYAKSLEAALESESPEVEALVDNLYGLFIGHELQNQSVKARTSLKVILLNLYSVHTSDPDLYLRYSTDEHFYGTKNRRYIGSSVSYSSLISKIIPGLLRLKLIEDHNGFHDRREFGQAFQSRMKAKPKLIELFNTYKLEPWMLSVSKAKEVIILKDQNKKLKPYADNSFTRKAREQLQHINRHLEAAVVDLDLPDQSMAELMLKMRRLEPDAMADDPSHLSLFTDKSLRRIFSNSSWTLHGRFYGGFWQNIPEREKQTIDGKEVKVPLRLRDNITINGSRTVELDYKSLHPRMIYDLAGLGMDDDPYCHIEGLDREHGKSLFNKMVNSLDEDEANGAYRSDFKSEGITKKQAQAAIEAVKERHPSIRDRFFTGFGLKLMFYDSQIANNVMLRAIDEFHTVVLPIHDSFICIAEFEHELKKLMEEEYMAVMETDLAPGIDQKDSEFYVPDDQRAEHAYYADEYGEIEEPEREADPGQRQRKEQLEKQAYKAKNKYNIAFEDAFKADSVYSKYAPNRWDDVF